MPTFWPRRRLRSVIWCGLVIALVIYFGDLHPFRRSQTAAEIDLELKTGHTAGASSVGLPPLAMELKKDDQGNLVEAVLANGYVRVTVDLRVGAIRAVQADSAGRGEYSASVLSDRGLVLERVDPDGSVVTASHPVTSTRRWIQCKVMSQTDR